MRPSLRDQWTPTWIFMLGACLAVGSACDKAPAPTPDERPSSPPFDPGLAVGEQAPDFQLADQHGESHSLTELIAAGNVALVFFRSADW